ncbi:MAG: AAA family ATPase, partial [Thermoleophilia bacterium]|nr:AAA family ATPase [Thermoleophilia bacterium]
MSVAPSRTLRFTRIRLENWRNFKCVEVELAQRVFLVGPNASGKSNFLDALRFLRDLAAVGGGLQSAVADPRRGGVSRIRSLAARKKTDVSIGVSVGSDDDPDHWQYELSFTQDSRKRALLQREIVTRRGEVIHERPQAEDKADRERRTQTSLEQVNVNREFRELVDFFASVRYLHIVPQLIREPDRSVGRSKDPFGGDFLEQVGTTPRTKRDSYLRQILKVAKV